MSYTVLARRYRSQTFDQVVGQQPIAQTLKSAIAHDRVAHAYLFCGTRGVGKTSMARIFAKAINTPDDQPEDVARAIMEGRDTDVIEIDAASNNKVEEARELIANCVYRPMRGKKKIYIIDEVHMLTTQAFNALLKTMEEPPEHVIFVLCTTETHKVPATIQSRCQRFDFKNISTASIAEHLTDVLARESITAEPDVIHAVARLGHGSMRDALSLLDRLIAAADDNTLTLAMLDELLGMPDRQRVHELLLSVANSDPAAALAHAAALLQTGISVDQLLSSLADKLRDVMVICACGHDTSLVDATDEHRASIAQLADRFDTAAVCYMIALCDAAARNAKTSVAPRAMLDALIVRLAMTENVAQVSALLAGAPTTAPANNSRGSPAKKA